MDSVDRELGRTASIADETKLQALMESTDNIITSVDLNYCLLTFNTAFRNHIKSSYGIPVAVGMRLEDYLPPARAALWFPLYDRALAEGSFRTEYSLPDGRTLELAINRIIHDGAITGISVFEKEITAQKASEKALMEAEKKFRGIFNGAIEGIFRTSFEGKPLLANPALARMLGYDSPDEYINVAGDVALSVFVDPSDRSTFIKLLREHGAVRGYECQFKRKDGTTIWVSIAGRLVCGADREPLYSEGFTEDITERKQAEQMLREQADLLDLAHDAIMTRGLDGTLRFWNHGAEEKYGYSKQQAIGQNSHSLLRTVFSRPLAEIEADLLRDGRWEGDLTHTAQSGQRIAVASRWVVQRDKNGQACGVMEMNRDITERKRAEEELERSEAELKDAQRIARLGNWSCDLKMGNVMWSEEMYRMKGLEPSPQGAPPYGEQERIFSPESWARLSAEVEKTVRTGLPYEVELEVMLPGGSKGWEFVRGEVVRDAAGEVVGLRGTAMNISERKQAEAEKALLQAEFAQAQKLEAVGRLAGGIAHDFNNLLMIISAHTELLALKLEGAEAHRAEEVMKASRRAAELTRQLLAFSRKQTIQPMVTSMNQLVTGVSDMLKRLVGEDIDIKIALQDGPWRVETDRSQFEQVIMNLVVNARDAMPEGGRLTLETANCEIGGEYIATHPLVPAGKYAMLAVSDSGTGMSADVQARLFEPFFTTKEPGKGTGLGLSMVYGIVKQSKGFVWAYSELGHGTTFKIYLPKADVNERAEPVRSAIQAQAVKKKATILLVEDEDNLREVVSHFLQSAGHKVIAAGDLDEACLAALEQRLEIDLLLTDVVLKGGNAKQLVRRLEEQGCSFRVMYMSGYTPEAIVHHGVLAPGTMFLQKPFAQALLLDKVEEALSGTG